MIDIQRFEVFCKLRVAKNRTLRWWLWKRKMARLGKLCNPAEAPLLSKCDILVIHANEELKLSGRKDFLLNKLKSAGFSMQEVVLQNEDEIIAKKLTSPPYLHQNYFHIFEGYANYLKKSYQPKLIITERNGCLFAPFLKRQNEGDAPTIHLPHCVLNDQTRNHWMMDYDYFPLYGPSSLNYLKSLKNGYGACQIFLGGSYLFDTNFNLPPPDKNLPILYLGMGPQLEEKKRGYITNKMVADWQKKSGRELLVRLHQRSKGTFWKNLNQPGVTLLPPEGFVESAKRCSMILSPYTNAVVDACLLNRPCQLVATPDEVDYLEVEKFFGKRATNPEEIGQRIDYHFDHFEESLHKCQELRDYHLSQGANSVNYLYELIVKILQGESPKPVAVRNYDGIFK